MKVSEYIEILKTLPQDYECISIFDGIFFESKTPHLPKDDCDFSEFYEMGKYWDNKFDRSHSVIIENET